MKKHLHKLAAALAIAGVLLAPASALAGAPAYSTSGASANNAATVNFTINSGTNQYLIAFVMTTGSCLPGNSDVTWNGTAMAKFTTPVTMGTTGERFNAFYLANPATGAHDLTIGGACSANGKSVLGITYTGVSGLGASSTQQYTSGTSFAKSITTGTDKSLVVSYMNEDGVGQTVSASTNVTSRLSGIFDTTAIGDSNTAVTPAGAFSQTWTGAGAPTGNAPALQFQLELLEVPITNPTISSISVTKAGNHNLYRIGTITGTGFQAGATVTLKKGGQTDITCTGVVVTNSTTLTGGTCDTRGKAVGAWDIYVANTDTGNGTGSALLTVYEARGVMSGASVF